MSEPKAVDVPLTLTLPVVCGMFLQSGWTASASGEPGEEIITAEFKRRDGKPREVSSHEIRDAFLAVKDAKDAVRFFSSYGAWEQSGVMTMARLRDNQERIRTARELTPREFFGGASADFTSSFYERQPWLCKVLVARAPFISFQAFHAGEAIWQANYVDQIGGVKASTCPKCGKQFTQPKGRKEKKFCSGLCQGRAAKAEWKRNQHKGVTGGKA